MARNLDHRIEIVVPVESVRIRHEIDSALDSALADDTNAWLLGPDGEWTRVEQADRPHSHHATMMRRAAKRTRRKIREQRSV
jgi:polyphosphate kinase